MGHRFLLSTDFFLSGADESRPVRFLACYDPHITPVWKPVRAQRAPEAPGAKRGRPLRSRRRSQTRVGTAPTTALVATEQLKSGPCPRALQARERLLRIGRATIEPEDLPIEQPREIGDKQNRRCSGQCDSAQRPAYAPTNKVKTAVT